MSTTTETGTAVTGTAVTTREDLASAVGFASGALMKRPVVPVLAGVLLQPGDGTLTVSGFDYETSASETIPADVDMPGPVLVSGAALAKTIKTLDKGAEVLLSYDAGNLTVESGPTRFTLLTLPLEDYPTLPTIGDTVLLEMPAARLARIAPKLATAAGRDDTLPVLEGVSIDVADGHASMVTTDRFRATLAELDRVDAPDSQTMISAATLAWAAKQFGRDGDVRIYAHDTEGASVVALTNGNRTVTTRALDATLPKVRRLFPTSWGTTVAVDPAVMTKAVKRVSTLAERNTPVRLEVSDVGDTVTVCTMNGDGEANASETVPATVMDHDYEPDGMTPVRAVAFNPQYLMDGLSVAGGTCTYIRLTTPTKPALLVPEDEDGITYLQMPIRMSE